MLWRPFFARVKVNHSRVYPGNLRKVCAAAMETGLVKNKAFDYLKKSSGRIDIKPLLSTLF